MKKVHSGRQLLHLFCNMTNGDLEGFRTSSRNIYFSGGVLYSYGTHYPMARKLSIGEGHDYREIVLINSHKSSVTTQKHKSQLRGSTKSSQWVFHVPNILQPKASENVEYLMDEVVDAVDAVLRGLKHYDIDSVTCAIENHNKYARAFRLKQFALDAEFYTLLATISRDTSARNAVKDKERDERQDAERAANRARWSKEVELWYSCKNTMNVSSDYFGLNYDPVRVNGDIVESPRGAQVDLSEAKQFAMALEAKKIVPGMKIGPFEVESIDDQFIQIGCHKLNIRQAIDAVLFNGGAQ